jgi:hypothetical protein
MQGWEKKTIMKPSKTGNKGIKLNSAHSRGSILTRKAGDNTSNTST